MALATTEQLLAHLRLDKRDLEVDGFDIWNTDTGATTATVEVTSSALVLTKTGGATPGSTSLAFSTYATLSTLLAAVAVYGNGWTTDRFSPSSSPSTNLSILASTSTLLYANRYPVQIYDLYWLGEVLDEAIGLVQQYCQRTFESTYHVQEQHSGDGSQSLMLWNFPVSESRDPVTVVIDGFDHTETVAGEYCDDANGTYELAYDSANDRWYVTVGPWGNALYVKYQNGQWECWTTNGAGTVTWTNAADNDDVPPESEWTDSDCCGSDDSTLHVFSYVGLEQYNGSSWDVVDRDNYLVDYKAGIIWGQSGYCFSAGEMNYRAYYTAGYSTIPDDLESLVLDIASLLYHKGGRDPMLKSDRLGSYSRTFYDEFLGPELVHRLSLWARMD